MRKMLCLLLAVLLLFTACEFSLTAGLDSEAQSVPNRLALSAVFSNDELYRRAQEELRDGAQLNLCSTTSIVKYAVENFHKQYPKIDGMAQYQGIDDEESSYANIRAEISRGGENAVDMAMLQNGIYLKDYLLDDKLCYNYFPASMEESAYEGYQDPAAVVMVSNLLVADKSVPYGEIHNIWQLTEPEWAGELYSKNPLNQTVNMNFLTVLTSVTWTEKLEEAYKSYYGVEWESREYDSAAYEWIAGFLKNIDYSVESSDGIMQEVAGGTTPKVALTVYSKLRNLTAQEYDNVNFLAVHSEIEGFSGFLYPIFATVSANTDCPYACALFINFLLSKEGFAGEGCWNQYQGYYANNRTIRKPTGMDDMQVEDCLRKLVFMDNDYIIDNYDTVYAFVREQLKYLIQ